MSVLIGFSALSGENPSEAIAMSLTYGLVVSLIVSALLTVPMWAVWAVAFSSIAPSVPNLRNRATVASGICAAIGAIGMMALLARSPDVDWSELLFLTPFVMAPIAVGALLTWRAFSPSRYHS